MGFIVGIFQWLWRNPRTALSIIGLIAIAGGLYYVYHLGELSERKKNDAMMAAIEKQYADEIVKKRTVVHDVVVKYVTKVVHDKDVNKQILKEVNTDEDIQHFPYPLPGVVRLRFNAAVQGDDPGPAGETDAAPVPLNDLTATSIENIGICRETADRLASLQAYVRTWAPAK